MPIEALDQKVLDLQAARMELNVLIRKLVKKKQVLDTHLRILWKDAPVRLARYQKNQGIVNYAEFDTSFAEYQRLDEAYNTIGSDGER